jgi:hypothetical protein
MLTLWALISTPDKRGGGRGATERAGGGAAQLPQCRAAGGDGLGGWLNGGGSGEEEEALRAGRRGRERQGLCALSTETGSAARTGAPAEADAGRASACLTEEVDFICEKLVSDNNF